MKWIYSTVNCFLLSIVIYPWMCLSEQTPASVSREPHRTSQIVFLEELTAYKKGDGLRDFSAKSTSREFLRTPYYVYRINAFGMIFNISLYKESTFLSPAFHVEHHSEDSIHRKVYFNEMHSCFYRGKVENDTDSSVALNACSGLHGLIQASFGEFSIEPYDKNMNEGPLRLVARRKHLITKMTTRKETTNRTISECDVKDSKHNTQKRVNHAYKLKVNKNGHVDAFKEHRRQRRSMSWRRYVETMVVADESMFDYYNGKELHLRRYLLSVMAIVTSIFRDSSVGNFIDISIVKLVILHKNPKNLKIRRTAAKSLKSFCVWQSKINKRSDRDPEHFDTAILITRKDLCGSSRKCDTLGLAELGTICNPYRSCSVVEDNGLSVGFTIAHELGHLFDSPHDGDHNSCTEKNEKVHVMTPSFSINAKTWSWSPCSKKYLTDFLDSGQGHCLFDKPSKGAEYHLSNKLPGETFTADEQCELLYGANYTVCPYIKTCSILWCSRRYGKNKACKTNEMPWVDGTKCGTNQWCIQGKCVKRKELKVVNGGWGQWHAYGPCSRTCGGGIQYSLRECDNPRPQNGGYYCLGLRRRYRSCNTQDCDGDPDKFRAEQCAAFNGKDLGIQGISTASHWNPKFTGVRNSDVCRLFCEVRDYNVYYELAPRVIDGTPCRRGSFDICVEGKCRPAGCDHKLGSDAKVDKCGVCAGDNSTCTMYTGTKNTTSYGYNVVVHVPVGASNLRVTQRSLTKDAADSNFLAVVGSNGRYIFNGNFYVKLGSDIYSDMGQNIYYSGPNVRNEYIWIPGIIKRKVIVYVLSVGKVLPPNIEYSFNVPVQGRQNYSWALDQEYGDCDFICQGSKKRVYRCLRQLDYQPVNDDKCIQPKPEPVVKKCNRHCRMKWSVKIDSVCSPPCGKGYRYQSVDCVKKFGNLTQHDEVVHEKFCRPIPKPPKKVACISECSNMRWIYTDWGKCTKKCGGGIQKRIVRCVDHKLRKVPFKECKNTKLLPLRRRCNNIGCPQWKLGEWTLCSVTCGSGIQHREVFCVNGLGKQTKHSVCDPRTRPSSTQPCELRSCPAWHFGAWTRCSVSCGIGYQTRKVGCRRADGELVVDAECNVGDRPLDRVECSGGRCPVVVLAAQEVKEDRAKAIWMTGAWTECSKTCDKGVKERYVSCRYINGEEAPDKLCGLEDKPKPLESCVVRHCPSWQVREWSECTEYCGGGTQTRQVFCGFKDGSKAEDHFCDSEQKPAERQSCNEHVCTTDQPTSKLKRGISVGMWIVTHWEPCSVTCGFGVRQRSVYCASLPTHPCDEKEKPPSTSVCKAGPCPGWDYGRWSPCSVTCGQGVRSRDVWCAFENGTTAHGSSCNQTFRPALKQTCVQKPCPELARWAVGRWQPCSVTCGKGFQFREITCENGHGLQMPERSCRHKGKPTYQRPCESNPCPNWIIENWSECDSSCIQTRRIFCGTGTRYFDEEVCSIETRPEETRECNSANCVKAPEFKWKIGPWSTCAKTCGYSVRNRNITCVNGSDETVPLAHCSTREPMPKNLEACFGGLCVPKWVTGQWSECSSSCGTGFQGREVHCEGMLNRRLGSGGCNKKRKPTAWRLCNSGECQRSFHWRASNWSKCTVKCGIGVTKRSVTCVNANGIKFDSSFCKVKRPPNMKVCIRRKCPPTSCRAVQKQQGIYYDGEHYLLVGKVYLKVYCAGMDTVKPREYITLRADPKENFSEIYGKRLRNRNICPSNGTRRRCDDCVDYSASGTTYFSKIRINLSSMVIITDDKKFAVKFGRNPPPFASAGDCFSQARCPQGRFRVNLKGTGLAIDSKVRWASRGYFSSQDIRKQLGGELVYGKCGGYCGMCSPTGNGLRVNLVHR